MCVSGLSIEPGFFATGTYFFADIYITIRPSLKQINPMQPILMYGIYGQGAKKPDPLSLRDVAKRLKYM